jgi:hypothetical protein
MDPMRDRLLGGALASRTDSADHAPISMKSIGNPPLADLSFLLSSTSILVTHRKWEGDARILKGKDRVLLLLFGQIAFHALRGVVLPGE